MNAKEVALRSNNQEFLPFSFADCFHIIASQKISALEAAQIALGKGPKWIDSLMQIRKIIVAPFGLKQVEPDALENSNSIEGFPIVSQNENKIILGFDDKHLDFRIVVETYFNENKTDIYSSTYVKTHNLLGKTYLFIIKPFHKLIVATCLNNIAKANLT